MNCKLIIIQGAVVVALVTSSVSLVDVFDLLEDEENKFFNLEAADLNAFRAPEANLSSSWDAEFSPRANESLILDEAEVELFEEDSGGAIEPGNEVELENSTVPFNPLPGNSVKVIFAFSSFITVVVVIVALESSLVAFSAPEVKEVQERRK